jgi:hypothetical protein
MLLVNLKLIRERDGTASDLQNPQNNIAKVLNGKKALMGGSLRCTKVQLMPCN